MYFLIENCNTLDEWITITHRHVTPGSHKGIGHRVNQLTRNTKIAYLDFTTTIYQNVTWLYVAMDDLMLISQVA